MLDFRRKIEAGATLVVLLLSWIHFVIFPSSFSPNSLLRPVYSSGINRLLLRLDITISLQSPQNVSHRHARHIGLCDLLDDASQCNPL